MRKITTCTQVIVISLILCFILAGCANDTPWRRTSTVTFELVGEGLSGARDTITILHGRKVLSDEKLAKAKELYNKALKIYATMGLTLIKAGKAETIIGRDQLLAQYDVLLKDFRELSAQIYSLIKDLK